jgi:glutamate---cysteine ligase / carboxylate-amine ligase
MSKPAAPLDVRDHRFGAGPPFTVGVEEEYMLLDPTTFDLVPGVEDLLRAERDGPFADLMSTELFESEVEFHTPVCRTIADVSAQLRRVRMHATATAAAQGLCLGCAGTHPFGHFEHQPVTERDRYRALVDVLQYAARRELIYGFHVHVAVSDPDIAVRLMALLQPHLCELVALAASSPFWRGEPTGFAACRPLIFSAFPRSGPPPSFAGFDEYASAVEQLVGAGCIEDYTRIWWDVRPHPRFGTIEVRVMDAVSRIDDAVALAAYVQALVVALTERAADMPLAVPHPVLSRENQWRAARYGLRATVMDPEEGGRIPVAGLILRSLERLAPVARGLGCERELAGVRRILRDGNGADRQLAVHAATGDPRAVARDITRVSAIAAIPQET